MKEKICTFLLNLILFSLLNTAFAQSQNGKIEGYVIDAKGNFISNLHVTLIDTKLGDVTDTDGYFVIPNIFPGIYCLKFDHIGFQTKIIDNIKIENGQIVNLGKIVLDPDVINLDGVVVTATRTDRLINEIAQPINVVSKNTIKQRNAKTSAEALREEVGVFVQKTNHGGGSAIIRGMSSNQILILVDGIRLNNSTYRLGNHQYLTTVDNHIVNRVEVVRGPASVLYGSDALGGTINLITDQPNLQSPTFKLGYNLLGRYASADGEKTIRSEISLQNHKIALLTGFSYKDYGDLRRGKNSNFFQLENSTNGIKQTPSGFKVYDFDSKLVYKPAQSQTIILAYQLSRQKNVPRYDKYENSGYARWLYQPQNRDLVYLIYKNSVQSKFITSLQASMSFHRQLEGREILKKTTSPLTTEKDDVQTTAITFQFNSIYRRHLVTYGAELYLDKVYSKRYITDLESGRTETDQRGRYPNGAVYNSLGIFTQDEIKLTQSLTTTFGLRYSYFYTEFNLPLRGWDKISYSFQSHKSSFINNIFKQNFQVNLSHPLNTDASDRFGKINSNFKSVTGSLSCVYEFDNQLWLNANIGQAFRAPNLSDISKLGESKGNTYEMPNPNLEPEKMVSFDMGFKFNYDKLKAYASAYYATITDLLASAPTTYNGLSTIEINDTVYKIKTKKNIGNAYIRGFEASINYNFYKQLFFYSNITTTYGQNKTNHEPVGGIPPTYGLVGLNWKSEYYSFFFYIRFASKQDRLSEDDKDDLRIPEGGTPGWETLNFRTRLSFMKFINLQLAIENIFDYNYREHGSGINGPGRNFILSLELER